MRVALLITLASGLLSAAPIGDLYNTGIGGLDGVDLHWKIDGNKAYVTDTTRYPFPLWHNDTPNAGWVSPSEDYTTTSDPADTTFVFATVFTLPSHFHSAYILMQLATDNALLDVKLNGQSINWPQSDVVLPGNSAPTGVILDGTGFSFGLGDPIGITSGFLPGQNSLEFHVRNSVTTLTNEGNPAGMIASFTSDVSTPEPASFALLGIGLAFLGSAAAMRRNNA
jgi:hypothetical protein